MPDTTIQAANVGRVARLAETSYADAHDAASADNVQNQYFNCTIGQYKSGTPTYSVYRGCLEFDLSAFSGLTLTSAKLRLYIAAGSPDTDFDITIVDGSDIATTIIAADFGELLDETTSWGSVSTSTITIPQWIEITLNGTGLAAVQAAIAGGVIRFGMRSSRDISNTAPTGWETINWTGITGPMTNSPELVGTWTGVVPSVTIQAVTNIVTTTARGHGNVTVLGTSDPTQHGHCWDVNASPDTGDSKTTLGAKSSTGTFISELTGLTDGLTYYIRAYATNTFGTSYSSELSFVAGTAGGQSYPTEAITRVTNLIHRYNRKEGVYELEMSLGEVTSDFGLPDWASSPKTLATSKEREQEIKRIIDDVRSYGFIPVPEQFQPGQPPSPPPIGLGPLGRAAREEQIFLPPEPVPSRPSISEWDRQVVFPGFTRPGEPVSTAKVTEERPPTDVQPGILDRALRMFRLRRARPVSIEEEKAKFARLRTTPKPEPVGISESIKRLMRFR